MRRHGKLSKKLVAATSLTMALVLSLGSLSAAKAAEETPDADATVEYVCGQTEHTHDDSCYSATEFSCGKEEHTHGGPGCPHWKKDDPQPEHGKDYCKKEEHTHTANCMILTCELGEHSHIDSCVKPAETPEQTENVTNTENNNVFDMNGVTAPITITVVDKDNADTPIEGAAVRLVVTDKAILSIFNDTDILGPIYTDKDGKCTFNVTVLGLQNGYDVVNYVLVQKDGYENGQEVKTAWGLDLGVFDWNGITHGLINWTNQGSMKVELAKDEVKPAEYTVSFTQGKETTSEKVEEGKSFTAPVGKNLATVNGVNVVFDKWVPEGEYTLADLANVTCDMQFKASYKYVVPFKFYRAIVEDITDGTTVDKTVGVATTKFTGCLATNQIDITELVVNGGLDYSSKAAMMAKFQLNETAANYKAETDGTVESKLTAAGLELFAEIGNDAKTIDWYVSKLENDGWHVDGKYVVVDDSQKDPTPSEDPEDDKKEEETVVVTPSVDISTLPTVTDPELTPAEEVEEEVLDVEEIAVPEGGDVVEPEDETEEETIEPETEVEEDTVEPETETVDPEDEVLEIEETETPAGEAEDTLPKTGTAPVALYYGIGSVLVIIGGIVVALRKKEEEA